MHGICIKHWRQQLKELPTPPEEVMYKASHIKNSVKMNQIQVLLESALVVRVT